MNRTSNQITKAFDLIAIIADRPRRMSELQEKLECSKRTTYRQLRVLQDVGFCVDIDFKGRYFLVKEVRPKFIDKFFDRTERSIVNTEKFYELEKQYS